MNKENSFNTGLELLVKKYRNQFRISENLNHYSPEDFKRAEKKYLKYLLGQSPEY